MENRLTITSKIALGYPGRNLVFSVGIRDVSFQQLIVWLSFCPPSSVRQLAVRYFFKAEYYFSYEVSHFSIDPRRIDDFNSFYRDNFTGVIFYFGKFDCSGGKIIIFLMISG